MPVATVDWTQILVALIAAAPAIIAAFYARSVKRDVQTPSKVPIGTQTESALHTGLGNAYRIETLRQQVGAGPATALPPMPSDAEPEPDTG